MVLRGAFFQIVVGLLVGIPIALVCVRFVKAQLYEIKSASPFIVIGAIATLTFAASVAAWIPARRAASIDPAEALRIE
jgi:ABC-type antimicrobial peptide transport system permease subunit